VLFADPVTERLNKALTAHLVKVGPHGYVHGWKFEGIPGVGDKVRLPGGRHGTVLGGNEKHAIIRDEAGREYHIPHDKGSGKARLVKDASKPDPKPVHESPRDAHNRPIAEASIAKGETLFHGTNHEFKPGDIIDAKHARSAVTRLHEGKQYAFASADPGEATFAGRAGNEGHLYRVEPVGKYEFDPHQGSTTSRRTQSGFRVVSEVQKWSGEKMAPPKPALNTMTPQEKKAYLRNGTLPERFR